MATLIALAIILFLLCIPKPSVDRMWSTFLIPPKHIGTPLSHRIFDYSLLVHSPLNRM